MEISPQKPDKYSIIRNVGLNRKRFDTGGKMQTVMTKPRKTKKAKTKSVFKTLVGKTVLKKSAATKKTPKEYVVIDHPANGETITSDYYCVRLGASPCERAEICINDKNWMPCRYAVGYWWFDWANFAPGSYKIKARMINSKGKPRISKIVNFKVRNGK